MLTIWARISIIFVLSPFVGVDEGGISGRRKKSLHLMLAKDIWGNKEKSRGSTDNKSARVEIDKLRASLM